MTETGYTPATPAPRPQLHAAKLKIIFDLLFEHFDEGHLRYRHDDWSDAKIALAADVPRIDVVSIREGAFGKLAVNPELAHEVSLLKEELRKLLSTHASVTDNFLTQMGKIEARLHAVEKKING